MMIADTRHPPACLPACSDSHTKNMFNAMRCLLIDFWDHNVGECAASNIMQLQQQLEKAALRGHIYNTPPRCLHLFGGGRVCLVHSPMGTTLLNDDPLVSSRGLDQITPVFGRCSSTGWDLSRLSTGSCSEP